MLSSGIAESAQALGLPPLLTAITVSPAVTSIAKGQTQQFTATGVYSDLSTKDLTDSVTWS
ncbi:MAG TPA: Ig-like domain-containing protein, partial [Acidimicrobiales bacterium]